MNQVLSSQWGSLSPHLIASFWEIDRKGKRIPGSPSVMAPLTDSNLEVALNWQSPFENAGNSQFPTTQQMLQSGVLSPLASKLDDLLGTNLAQLAAGLEGKTSVTKLNSTQIFVGATGAKFNITALFRAWNDPVSEVHDPFNQLWKWALPVKLSDDFSLLGRLVQNGISVETPFPSDAPRMLAIKYKDCTYWPLVIENITKDTNAPVDKNGHFTSLSVSMALTTLTAIDRGDWDNFTGNIGAPR